ncbi:hypothetical protein CEXT_540961 [Caerostris extrusa]|uniref:Uncharacterized protein n=1 Tax=Caerostris extrusa TaxID=172846 RepID=A0AAV4YGA2_CAEEX|nr:hypothetical protein CEXT_540961 [Caerostris extrusa]
MFPKAIRKPPAGNESLPKISNPVDEHITFADAHKKQWQFTPQSQPATSRGNIPSNEDLNSLDKILLIVKNFLLYSNLQVEYFLFSINYKAVAAKSRK